MFKKEMYRIMIKENFLILLFIFVFIKILIASSTEYAYSWKSDRETEFYLKYMEEISGRGEEGKYDRIERDYKDEKIMGQHYSAMEAVWSDYQYVLEDEEKHWFLKDDGFELFFLHSDIDWLCLFLIIFLATQMVSKDYICGVVQITQTSLLGRERLAVFRALLMMGLTAVITIIFTASNLLSYGINHGLSSGNAPIQSVSMLGTSEKELTVLQAWLFMMLLRMIAYVIFGMLIFAMASVCKNMSFCMFAGFGMVFFPLFLLRGTYYQEKLYKTMIPIKNLDGIGFFIGDSIAAGEDKYFFQELSMADIAVIYAVQLIIGLAVVSLSVVRLSGGHRNIRRFWHKKIKFIILFLCCLVFCHGCSGYQSLQTQDEKILGRDLVTKQYVKIDEKHFYDIEDKKIYETGETILDEERILAIGNTYILTAKKEIKGNTKNEFSIELLDNKKNKRQTLIRFGQNADMAAFMGLDNIINMNFLSDSGQEIQNMGINESVVYENNCIYYAYNNVVIKADCENKEYSIIYQTSEMKNTIICNDRIYYINGLEQLICYDVKAGEAARLLENIGQMWLDSDKIFISKADEGGLFMGDIEEGPVKGELPLRKISEKMPERLDAEGDKVVFESEGKIYMCRYEEEKVFEEELETEDNTSMAGISGNKMYVIQYGEEIKVIEYDCNSYD